MKKGLGRGFGSLIPTNLIDETFDPTAQQDVKVSHLRDIAIDQVVPDPDQPRRFFDENALNELTESVREHGVVQPIVVTPKGDKYLIVAGERRWRAANRANLTEVPCIVRSMSDQNRLEISLIENLQRHNFNSSQPATIAIIIPIIARIILVINFFLRFCLRSCRWEGLVFSSIAANDSLIFCFNLLAEVGC
jgi:ParB family transcriptional regulator, chromosome partitioning protein